VVVSRRACVVNRLINAARPAQITISNVVVRPARTPVPSVRRPHRRPFVGGEFLQTPGRPRSINSGARPIHPDHLSFRLIYVTCMPDRAMEHIVNVVSPIPTAVLVSDIGLSVVLARAPAYIRHSDGVLPLKLLLPPDYRQMDGLCGMTWIAKSSAAGPRRNAISGSKASTTHSVTISQLQYHHRQNDNIVICWYCTVPIAN